MEFWHERDKMNKKILRKEEFRKERDKLRKEIIRTYGIPKLIKQGKNEDNN